MEQKRKCVFAGTFDPPTLGHKATVEDCLKIFDEVVVALLINPAKTPYFTVEERLDMLALTVQGNDRVRILTWDGTIAELLKKENTNFYVRGIRNGIDLDYENANFYASKKLNADLVEIYLPCRQELLHVSSSVVRNSLKFAVPIDDYVMADVKEYITKVKRS